jgi:hypothetical protein
MQNNNTLFVLVVDGTEGLLERSGPIRRVQVEDMHLGYPEQFEGGLHRGVDVLRLV